MRVVFGRKFGKFMKFRVKQKLGKMVKLRELNSNLISWLNVEI